MADVTPEWVALDRGPRTLRAWAMKDSRVLAQAKTEDGTAALDPTRITSTLRHLFSGWSVTGQTPVVACGLDAGGPYGVPRRTVPCAPLDGAPTAFGDGAFNLHLVPGLSQSRPADIMGGDETRIAGFASLNPNWDGVICLAGPHTKWAQISAGEVVSFQTFMTAEVFGLLADTSALRPSVAGTEIDEDAFLDSLGDTLSRPETLAARLFTIRAQNLIAGTEAEIGRARLWGLLIGAELAAARPYWLGQNLALIGTAPQDRLYAQALQTQGAPATVADAARMTLAGLTTAYRNLKGRQ